MADLLSRLRFARSLVAKGWSANSPALNERAFPVSVFAHDATAFSLTGALDRAFGITREMVEAYDFVKAVLPAEWRNLPLGAFNSAPGRTRSEVLAVLDLAMQRAADHV